jgi:dissimilatory sulfite reductase (desulfoviridin) alpha/beta subunit
MGLYPEWRKQAHYAIVVKGQTGAKFAPEVSLEAVQSDESIQDNIQKLFVMYKDRGMDVEEIDTKLRSNFSEQAVDKFFEKVPSGN